MLSVGFGVDIRGVAHQHWSPLNGTNFARHRMVATVHWILHYGPRTVHLHGTRVVVSFVGFFGGITMSAEFNVCSATFADFVP